MENSFKKCSRCSALVVVSITSYLFFQPVICEKCSEMSHASPHTHQVEYSHSQIVQSLAISGTPLSASPSSSPSPAPEKDVSGV